MEYLVTIHLSKGQKIMHLNKPGQVFEVLLPPHPIGGSYPIGVGVDPSPYGDRQPGSLLLDARDITMVDRESPEGIIVEPLVWPGPTWDVSYIPSSRTLAQIMQDVVDHTAKHPTHGAMCVCMDEYSREIRIHLRKAMPPDTRRLVEDEWPREDQATVQARVMAHQRIAHVLGMVMRNL